MEVTGESTSFYFNSLLEVLEIVVLGGMYSHLMLSFQGNLLIHYCVLVSQLLINLDLHLPKAFIDTFILLIKKWNIWKTFCNVYLASEPFKNPPLIINLCWRNISMKYSFMYVVFFRFISGSSFCKVTLWTAEFCKLKNWYFLHYHSLLLWTFKITLKAF